MKQPTFPEGWDEERVRRVLERVRVYDPHSDEHPRGTRSRSRTLLAKLRLLHLRDGRVVLRLTRVGRHRGVIGVRVVYAELDPFLTSLETRPILTPVVVRRFFRASVVLCATVLNLAFPMLPPQHVHAAEAGEAHVTLHRHHFEVHVPSPAPSAAALPQLRGCSHQHGDHRFAQVIAALVETALHFKFEVPVVSTTTTATAPLTTGERPIAAADERLNHGPPPPRTSPRAPPTYSA